MGWRECGVHICIIHGQCINERVPGGRTEHLFEDTTKTNDISDGSDEYLSPFLSLEDSQRDPRYHETGTRRCVTGRRVFQTLVAIATQTSGLVGLSRRF